MKGSSNDIVITQYLSPRFRHGLFKSIFVAVQSQIQKLSIKTISKIKFFTFLLQRLLRKWATHHYPCIYNANAQYCFSEVEQHGFENEEKDM